ncbi:MAG TPA: type II toxin-antitoxin system HicB family antitoxin [Candidatus Paceibacterota bacterium]
MKVLNYTVKVHPAAEGGFWAEVPALPGCFTQGNTVEEIAVMAKEAIEGFIKGLIRRNQPVPIEKKIKKKKKLQSFSFPLSVQVRQRA